MEGLPSVKKFRRRTRLQQAAANNLMMQSVVKKTLGYLSEFKRAIDVLGAEANWSYGHEKKIYTWVGEEDPILLVRKATERFDAQMSGARRDGGDPAQLSDGREESNSRLVEVSNDVGAPGESVSGVGAGDPA